MREIPIQIPNEALLHPALPGAPMVHCRVRTSPNHDPTPNPNLNTRPLTLPLSLTVYPNP